MKLDAFEVPVVEAPAGRGAALRFLPAVNLEWARRAAGLRGHCLAMGLVLKLQWELAQRSPFAAQSALSASMGINRYAERRALLALEAEGLITVSRRRGRRPRIAVVGADV